MLPEDVSGEGWGAGRLQEAGGGALLTDQRQGTIDLAS